MLKAFKYLGVLAVVVTMLMGGAVGQKAAYADNTPTPTTTSVCTGDATTGSQINCLDPNASTLNSKMFNFARALAGLVLGVSVIMIVYAGFKYSASQGDPKATESAKMQMIAAGIGIGIAFMAFVILNLFKSALGVG